MSDQLLLTAETGRDEGTRPSRRLRRDGRIPAVVYGLGADPVAVSVAWPDLRAVLTTDAGVNAVITLSIDGEQQLSIVKDLQRHPVRRDVIHLEVTRANGMVDQTLYHLTVSAKPAEVPDEIEVDISGLTLGDAIHVSDLALPAGVTTAVDPGDTVAVSLVTRSTREAMAAEDAADAADDDAPVGGTTDSDATDGADDADDADGDDD